MLEDKETRKPEWELSVAVAIRALADAVLELSDAVVTAGILVGKVETDLRIGTYAVEDKLGKAYSAARHRRRAR